jgi:hypothetical protein
MHLVRKLALGVATLSVAFGAGHVVQSEIETAPQPGKVETALVDTPLEHAANVKTPLARPAGLGLSDPTLGALDKALTPWARKSAPRVVLADAEVALPGEAQPTPVEEIVSADSGDCTPNLSVKPREGAVLDVLLVAPCAKDSRVILRHGGLALTAHTNATGALSLMLPALDRAGEVTAMFKDGHRAEAAATVEMAGLRRFAVQWLSDDAVQLQVYEDGAAFGAPGNVSAARPQGAGFLVALGDARTDLSLMSEIYTFPAAGLPVQVTLEAEVTEANCGREVLGQTLDSVDGTVKTSDITLTMPGCEAVGDILVLNNLVGDTTLAQAE